MPDKEEHRAGASWEMLTVGFREEHCWNGQPSDRGRPRNRSNRTVRTVASVEVWMCSFVLGVHANAVTGTVHA